MANLTEILLAVHENRVLIAKALDIVRELKGEMDSLERGELPDKYIPDSYPERDLGDSGEN